MPYDAKTLEQLREDLLARRSAVARSVRGNQRELEGLRSQERFAEMEDGAQSASAEYVLTQLSDSARLEIAQIDGALSRIDAGSYGECSECGNPIPLARLRALPYALRDAECSSLMEPARQYPSL